MIMNAHYAFRSLGATGYTCHVMGFGCYRIADGSATHEKALEKYLNLGGNLIDTSANYGDGLSEILIGKVLKRIDRSRAIVVTKGGYIQGQNMRLAQEMDFPEVVKYGDGLWHCIHPEFLKTQIDRSLRRMQLDYGDVFLLHNPEYYINHAAQTQPITESVLDEFYRRIQTAFQYLETEVQTGRIRYYGISSNNFGLHEKDRARTSVKRALEKAEQISAGHHFRVVQLPMNVYESGGALYPTHDGKSVLQFCKDNGIGVLLNRPLNAFYQGKLYRLADYVKPGREKPDENFLDNLLQPLQMLENECVRTFDGEAFGQKGEGLAAYLKYIALDLPSPDYWNGVMDQYIVPPVTQWMRRGAELHNVHPQWNDWQNRFIRTINETLEGIENFLYTSNQPVSDRIRTNLYRAGYPESAETLSRIAMALLAQLDGVSCVLNGMRTSEYVDDAMGVPSMPAVESLPILQRFQSFTDI